MPKNKQLNQMFVNFVLANLHPSFMVAALMICVAVVTDAR